MSKKFVAYFSASGTTAKVAENLAKAAGADLYEIKPDVPYTKTAPFSHFANVMRKGCGKILPKNSGVKLYAVDE